MYVYIYISSGYNGDWIWDGYWTDNTVNMGLSKSGRSQHGDFGRSHREGFGIGFTAVVHVRIKTKLASQLCG